MGDRTKIEWTDATWNPLRARNVETGRVGHFCEKVSPACANCYAERWNLTGRGGMGTQLPYAASSRDTLELCLDERTLLQPLRWRRARRVFVCSMTDLFLSHHDPATMIAPIFAVMALAEQHTFQVLTKRPHVMRDLLNYDGFSEAVYFETCAIGDRLGWDVLFDAWPLPNVGLGVTAEDQQRLDERLPALLETPAAWRFVSAEPLLGPIAFRGDSIDQVIVGGESGTHARPMPAAWVRAVRDNCTDGGAAFFFKQWGEWLPIDQQPDLPTEQRIKYRSTVVCGEQLLRVGRKQAGRMLDGRTWSEQVDQI